MIRLIRHFLLYLREYDMFMGWWNHYSPEQKEQILSEDDWFPKNRFDYAWYNTKIWYKHRDRYSRKCTGDCENCTLKHC